MLIAVYVSVMAMLAVFAVHRLYLTFLSLRGHLHCPSWSLQASRLPVVTIQLPVYNERYVVDRAITALGALDWPSDCLEIQVLDDSTDETRGLIDEAVLALRRRGIDAKAIRRVNRDGYKAGALEHGRAQARGEFFLVLDADFVADSALLRRTMGYFADPSVGMVQLAWHHNNRTATWLTRAQAMLLDGHFGVEQRARARAGRFFNFNGTAGIWRGVAIEAAGGWQADTVTEDFDLSYRALLAGWHFVFVEGPGVDSELPGDLNAFRSQQYRWAKGSAQVAKKLLGRVWGAPISLATKIDATFHLLQNVPYLLTTILAVTMVPVLVGSNAPTRSALLPLHVLGAALTAVTLLSYLVVAARHLGHSVVKAGLLGVPLVFAVTFAMCLNQGRAVIAGVVSTGGEFVRTAKHGHDAVAGRWRQSAYRGAVSKSVVLEFGLAAWFGLGLLRIDAAQSAMATTTLVVGALAMGTMGMAAMLRR